MILLAQKLIFIKEIDFIIAPIVFFTIMCFTYVYSKKKYLSTSIQFYFRLGMALRLIGAIFIGLIMQYYYSHADTYNYYIGAYDLNTNYFTDFKNTLLFLWRDSSYFFDHGFCVSNFDGRDNIYSRDSLGLSSSLFLMKIGGMIGFLTFNTYLSTSLFFAFFSFLGSWKLFKVFYDLYPKLHKQLAISTLFIPSVLIWGSGFMKDSIIVGALGFLTCSTYHFFLKKENLLKNGIIIFISSYLIIRLKIYVFLAFFPSLLCWILLKNKERILKKSPFKKTVTIAMVATFILVIGIGGYISLTSIKVFSEYSPDMVAKKATSLIKHYQEINLQGAGEEALSNYSIGTFEPTILGMLKKIPQAVNVTLYRPYLWEVEKGITVPAAIESTFFLIFTLWVILKRKIIYFIRDIFTNSDVFFCITFTLILAFIVGIGTANFGTLMRYKIPCLPFFLIALFILNSSTDFVPKLDSKQNDN